MSDEIDNAKEKDVFQQITKLKNLYIIILLIVILIEFGVKPQDVHLISLLL